MAKEWIIRRLRSRNMAFVIILLTAALPLTGYAKPTNQSLLASRRCEVILQSPEKAVAAIESAGDHPPEQRLAQAVSVARQNLDYFISHMEKFALTQDQVERLAKDYFVTVVMANILHCRYQSCFEEQSNAWGKWLPARLKALGVSAAVRADWLSNIPRASSEGLRSRYMFVNRRRLLLALRALDLQNSSAKSVVDAIYKELNSFSDTQMGVNDFLETGVAGRGLIAALLNYIATDGKKYDRVVVALYSNPKFHFAELNLTKEARVKLAKAIMANDDRHPVSVDQLLKDLGLSDTALREDLMSQATPYDRIENIRLKPHLSPQDLDTVGKILGEMKNERSFGGIFGSGNPKYCRLLLRLAADPKVPESFLLNQMQVLKVRTFEYSDFEFLSDIPAPDVVRAIAFAQRINPDAHPFSNLMLSMSAPQREAMLEYYEESNQYIYEYNPDLFLGLPKGRKFAFSRALISARGSLGAEAVQDVVALSRELHFTDDQVRELSQVNFGLAEAFGLSKMTPSDYQVSLINWAKKLQDGDRTGGDEVNACRKLLGVAREHLNPDDRMEILFLLAPRFQKYVWLLRELGIESEFRSERRLQFAIDPFAVMNQVSAGLINPVGDNTPAREVIAAFQFLSHLAPSIFPPSQYEDIAGMTNTNAIVSAVALRAELELRLGHALTGLNSTELVAVTLGLDAGLASRANFSQNHIANLVVAAREISRNCGLNCFAHITFDLDLTKKGSQADFISLINVMRDYVSLQPVYNFDRKLHDLVNTIGPQVNSQNAAAIEAMFRERIVVAVRNLFSGKLRTFSYERLKRLKEEWGDLSPIWTLLARYKSNGWGSEIPVLGTIFEHSLNGTFMDLKYKGDPDTDNDVKLAKEQLSMLKREEDIQILQKPHHLLTAYSPSSHSRAMDDNEILRQSLAVVSTNVIPNLARNGYRLGELSSADGKVIMGLLSSIPNNPLEFVDVLVREPRLQMGAQTNDRVFAALISILPQAADLAMKRFVTRVALFMVQKHMVPGLLANPDGAHETIADLRTLINVMNPVTESGQQAILFTTTLHHPKTLLSIGDWVQAASCQNYRTGAMIYTLPSYVIDANVTAIAGYALTPGQFEHDEKDFSLLFEALRSRQTIESKFDEVAKVISFAWRQNGNGYEIHTHPIAYAFHRQIVRIGATRDGGPGIFAERAYTQSHFASRAIQDQANALVELLGSELGAKVNAPLSIVGSRNESGGYTDAGGGVHAKGMAFDLQPNSPK